MSAFTWSLAETHCPWCGKDVSESFTHSAVGGGCAAVERRSGGLIGRTAIAAELRGLAEAQAAVIARYRAGWAPRERDGVPRWMHDDYLPLKWEPMTDAERQVLYPANPQPEGTTP